MDNCNANFLQPTQFKLTIDKQKYGTFEVFCVSAPLPTVTLPQSELSFRGNRFAEDGETVNYDDFNVRFLVDENMDNYKEIFDWIHRNNIGERERADIVLSILSSHNNTVKQIRFVGAFPINLSGVEFNSQDTTNEYLTADTTFHYTYFEFI